MKTMSVYPAIRNLVFIFSFYLLISASQDPITLELERIKAGIEKEKKELESKIQKERQILDQIELIDKRIQLYEKSLSQLRARRAKLEKEIKNLEKEIEKIKAELKRKREILAKRFRARYQMGEIGALEVLFSANTISDLVLRDEYLTRIYLLDQSLIQEYERILGELEKKREELKKRENELSANIQAQTWAKDKMEQEKIDKSELLNKIQTEKEAHLSILAELERAERELERKLSSLEEERAQALNPFPDSGFELYKGKLCLPTMGRVEEKFGIKIDPQFQTKTFNKGIDIRASPGALVRSLFSGQVVFADWFRGYGNLVIIDHGGSYYTLYAHLDQIYKTSGEIVKKGDKIGTVGETGSLKGVFLYFELRHHSDALNPEEWLNSSCVEQGK